MMRKAFTIGSISDIETKNTLKDFTKIKLNKIISLDQRIKKRFPLLIEQFFLKCLIFNKISLSIDNEKIVFVTLDQDIDKYLEVCYNELAILKEKYPLRISAIYDMINKYSGTTDYGELYFTNLEDNRIDYVASLKNYSTVSEITDDETFNISMFNIDFKYIIDSRRLSNLKNLYINTLLPIILYYKSHYETTKILINIDESISLDDKQKALGRAVTFSLNNFSSKLIIKDILDNKIPVQYGLLKKIDDTKMYISLPYTTSNKAINKIYIDESNI